MTGKDGTATVGTAPGWLGIALLAMWLGFIIPAFGQFRPAASADPAAPAAILDWLRGTGHMPAGTATATAYRMPDPACRCVAVAGAGEEAWSGIEGGLAGAALDLVDLSALPAPPTLPYELVVLDADARLVYAGPLQFADVCGAAPITAASMLPGLLGTPGAPYISTSDCRC